MSAGDENYEAIRGELKGSRRDHRKRCLDESEIIEEKSSKLEHHRDFVPKN